MESNSDSWKVFNRDTEAGRLLSRLYGVAPSGRVSYPKHQRRRRRRVTDGNASNDTKNDEIPTRSWKTTYTVHGWNKACEEEEKERERKENISRALSLKVPKVGRGVAEQRHSSVVDTSHASIKIDLVPRRKTELGCSASVQEIKFLAISPF